GSPRTRCSPLFPYTTLFRSNLVGDSKFVLVVEALNGSGGLGSRFGSWLLERGHAPVYAHMGVNRVGVGGLDEQIEHQGLDAASILTKLEQLLQGSTDSH